MEGEILTKSETTERTTPIVLMIATSSSPGHVKVGVRTPSCSTAC